MFGWTPRFEGNGIGVRVPGERGVTWSPGRISGKGKVGLGKGCFIASNWEGFVPRHICGIEVVVGGFVVYFFFVCFFAE